MNAKKVFERLSVVDRQFVTLAVLEYAEQKLCPDVFLNNVGREYDTKRVDGATTAAAAYKRAARLWGEVAA